MQTSTSSADRLVLCTYYLASIVGIEEDVSGSFFNFTLELKHQDSGERTRTEATSTGHKLR
jgi:hypothetical protein